MMTTNSDTGPALYRENPPPYGANRSSPAAADAILEFGRFRVLLRRRQLVADGVPGWGRAPSISSWPCWRPTDRSSPRKSS